jgi:glycosyltransferase involved in cell wall biosynthesis
MRVLFIAPSFYPASFYGGPIHINYAFCNALAQTEQLQLAVLTTDTNGPRRLSMPSVPVSLPEGYDIYYCRRVIRPDISAGLLLRLFGMIRKADIIHLNGVYSFTTIPTLALCRLLNKPVVWSTLGSLQRWPGSTRTFTKRLWEKICNSLCDPERVVLHVTSEDDKVESLSKINSASAVIIRNGIDISKLDRDESRPQVGDVRLLYLGRLHPIKGIENLLRALPMMKTSISLSICGEGDSSYQKELVLLAKELAIADRVHFRGRVDGEDKERQFRGADLVVVPSFKESFCTVVVESLARGIPVIASRGTPWQSINEVKCGLWVGNSPQELSRAVAQAASMPLREMGLRGRKWMEEEFSWARVVEEMIEQYRALIAISEVRRKQSARHSQAA